MAKQKLKGKKLRKAQKKAMFERDFPGVDLSVIPGKSFKKKLKNWARYGMMKQAMQPFLPGHEIIKFGEGEGQFKPPQQVYGPDRGHLPAEEGGMMTGRQPSYSYDAQRKAAAPKPEPFQVSPPRSSREFEERGMMGGQQPQAEQPPQARPGGAQHELMKTMGGAYLSPGSNPFLSQTFNRAARDVSRNYQQNVAPEIRRAAVGAGAFGGSRQGIVQGQAQENLARELGGIATDIYGRNYADERNRQLQAVGMAPTFANLEYQDIDRLAGVGAQRRDLQQQFINDAIKRFQFGQLEPWQRMGMQSQFFNLPYGGQATNFGDVYSQGGSSGGGK